MWSEETIDKEARNYTQKFLEENGDEWATQIGLCDLESAFIYGCKFILDNTQKE